MQSKVVKSAGRVLALLEFLRERRDQVSVADVAAGLDMPQSSTSVLLKSLVTLGYLLQDSSTRKFRASFRVALLGDWVTDSNFGEKSIVAVMESLGRATGETVLLGQRNGPYVQYLNIVPAAYPVQLYLRAGTERPMTRAALGMVLLSQMRERDVKGVIRRNNAEASKPRLKVGEREFLEHLVTVRRQGHAMTSGHMTPGAAVIAVPLPHMPGLPPMALGLGGPTERIEADARRFLKALKDHAASLAPKK